MVIEWLKFRVTAGSRETFVQLEEEIWSRALTEYPGYLGKEVWLDPEADDRVAIVARWRNREQLDAVPADVVARLEANFNAAFGANNYDLLEVKVFQVRKYCSGDA